jgi:hypothetical protein
MRSVRFCAETVLDIGCGAVTVVHGVNALARQPAKPAFSEVGAAP